MWAKKIFCSHNAADAADARTFRCNRIHLLECNVSVSFSRFIVKITRNESCSRRNNRSRELRQVQENNHVDPCVWCCVCCTSDHSSALVQHVQYDQHTVAAVLGINTSIRLYHKCFNIFDTSIPQMFQYFSNIFEFFDLKQSMLENRRIQRFLCFDFPPSAPFVLHIIPPGGLLDLNADVVKGIQIKLLERIKVP